jgi:hypothetical protein
LAQNYAEAQAAAEDYLATTRRGYDQERETALLGPIEKGRVQGRVQIEDKYSGERQRLESERRTGAFDNMPGEYERLIALNKSSLDIALADWDTHYRDRTAMEQSSMAGMVKGLREYADEASLSAASAGAAFQGLFRGFEDLILSGGGDKGEKDKLRGELSALEERRAGVEGGRHKPEDKERMVAEIDDKIRKVRERLKDAKSEFQTIIEQFQQDISRMLIRQTIMGPFAAFLASALGGMMGGGGGGFRTTGGGGFGTGSNFGNLDYGMFMATGTNRVPYDGFKAVLHKDEAVVPAKFNPAVGGAGGGHTTIVQNISYTSGGGGNDDPQRMARMVREQAVAGIDERNRRRGSG